MIIEAIMVVIIKLDSRMCCSFLSVNGSIADLAGAVIVVIVNSLLG